MAMKELTNRTILSSYELLMPLAKADYLPIALKTAVRRVWRVLRPEGEQFIEARNDLWDEHGLRNEKGELVKQVIGDVVRQLFPSKQVEEQVDAEWRSHMKQVAPLELQPIPLALIEEAEERLARTDRSVPLDADGLDRLIEAGIISEGETEKPKEEKKTHG